MPGPARMPDKDFTELPRGTHSHGNGKSTFYAGRWRSADGIERFKQRQRLLQRERRAQQQKDK